MRAAPTRSATGRQSRGDLTRQKILDEAVACILEEGFTAASAKHIAERAGVTWGVVQYHFGDRSGILAAVTQAGLEQSLARLGDLPASHGDPGDQIRALVQAAWEAFNGPISRAGFEILIAARGDPLPELDAQMGTFAREIKRLTFRISPDCSGDIGRVLLSSLRGMALVQMTAANDLDFAGELLALEKVLTSFLDAAGG